MPELPEVETTCRGIRPYLENRRFETVIIRQRQLRWPVPNRLDRQLHGLTVRAVERRAKYLLIGTDPGTVLIHLGMSGSLRILTEQQPVTRHDHVDFVFADGLVLRFNDPRRFGAVLWTTEPVLAHPLLKNLGPEPLAPEFDGNYLYALAENRSAPVKAFIMDSRNVVGVGNIYANEALFRAGIRPDRQAGRISSKRYQKLALSIREVLNDAIAQGGTTLRDFVSETGKPGYFKQQLRVYGRGGQPCPNCFEPLTEIRLANRSTVYCRRCQR